jgi:hypothetical protein
MLEDLAHALRLLRELLDSEQQLESIGLLQHMNTNASARTMALHQVLARDHHNELRKRARALLG